ncbi:hypothetical protein ACQ86B_24255 [Mycolicibacterium aichiense]|uniref:hypothetical protein n=1 Tax=Mycolicibacterium aichiense TaxID=1799 RepID=UPI003D6698AF
MVLEDGIIHQPEVTDERRDGGCVMVPTVMVQQLAEGLIRAYVNCVDMSPPMADPEKQSG